MSDSTYGGYHDIFNQVKKRKQFFVISKNNVQF